MYFITLSNVSISLLLLQGYKRSSNYILIFGMVLLHSVCVCSRRSVTNNKLIKKNVHMDIYTIYTYTAYINIMTHDAIIAR